MQCLQYLACSRISSLHLGQVFCAAAVVSAFGDDLTEFIISTLISTLESSNSLERFRLRSESEHLEVIVAFQLIGKDVGRETTRESKIDNLRAAFSSSNNICQLRRCNA